MGDAEQRRVLRSGRWVEMKTSAICSGTNSRKAGLQGPSTPADKENFHVKFIEIVESRLFIQT
jgi:hypothetical protein